MSRSNTVSNDQQEAKYKEVTEWPSYKRPECVGLFLSIRSAPTDTSLLYAKYLNCGISSGITTSEIGEGKNKCPFQ